MMSKEEIGEYIANMVRMLGIPKERFHILADEMETLMNTDPADIVIYNTVTVNYTEKEQKLIFFIWGVGVGVDFDGNE